MIDVDRTARMAVGLAAICMQLGAAVAQEPEPGTPEGEACPAALADLGVEAEPATLDPAEEACAVEQPVRLQRLTTDSGTLAFAEPPTLACGFALALTRWLAESAMPAARAQLGQPLVTVLAGPGYACRPRNQQPGAELSVHAFGIALDIRGFELADGAQVLIGPGDRAPPERRFLDALRTSACGYFTTVLGPGSDPFHADHLHVDLASRGSPEYRVCE